MSPYLHFVRLHQVLRHGLDDELKEEPAVLKPGDVRFLVNIHFLNIYLYNQLHEEQITGEFWLTSVKSNYWIN